MASLLATASSVGMPEHSHPVHGMPPSQVACMTHHVTGLWVLAAVKRLEVAMEDASVVETVGTPEAWAEVMKR